jgi:penicillin-binding protein 1C
MKEWLPVRTFRNWSRKKKILVAGSLVFLLVFYFSLPKQLFHCSYSTVLYDAQNKLLSARIARDGQWRFPYSDSIPEKFEKCIIEFEDRHFYHHPGVNIVSVSKALYHNLKGKGKKTGGSTITMQLARLSRSNPERTYFEKFIEMWLAVRIECSYSKKTILNYYACNAPFGGNVVGLHAAAWRYFGRDPFQLSWAESALLAVLPNAPALIYPGKNHSILLKKRNKLLLRLYEKGIIDKATYDLSLLEKLPEKPIALPQLAPHLLQKSVYDYGEGNIYKSTLNKEIQEQTTALLEKHIGGLRSNQINNACALVLDTKTGNVIAYVGNSTETGKENQNDVDIILSPRSSGSILKPILYALLLNEGKIAPHALIEDVPMQIGSYAPKNFNLTYDGVVPASQAIARSLNVPAVKMLQAYGPATLLYQFQKLGFTTMNKPATHYGLSLILGGAEVTPWDIGSVYASLGRSLITFNNSGHYNINDIHPANYLQENEKTEIAFSKDSPLKAGSIWLTLSAMTELARPEDYAANSTFLSLNRIAWKTGTSFGFRDAWAVGLNQKYTIVVWVGNADGEGRQGLTGINAAAPLLFSVFNMLGKPQWFQKPVKDLVEIATCKQSGYRASENCPDKKTIEVPASVLKSPLCSFHKIIHVDSSGRFQVNGQCYPVALMKHKPFLVLTPLEEYFYKKRHVEYDGPPSYLENCTSDAQITGFDIVYPRNGFKIYLPVDENAERGHLIMNAAHRKNNAKLFWYLDKIYLGETVNIHQMETAPEKGKHVLEIFEEKGNSVKVNFEIVGKEKPLDTK